MRRVRNLTPFSLRKTIVEGAVEIAHGAIQRLEDRGIKLEHAEKTKLVSNLLVVIW